MGMRTDCRHYSRRSSASGEVAESCELGVAPDAPLRCPEDCPHFEARRLSTLGFDRGDLGASPAAAPDADGVDALFAELRDVVDDVAGDVVAAEAERRKADAVRARRKARKRIR